MASQWIFPTSMYGLLSDVYGTAVTQYNTYPNTTGFPAGSGLTLGQFGLLFDGSMTRMFKASAGIAQNLAVTYVIGNSNDYTVQTTTTANTIPIIASSDRAGSTALVANNYAWMTCYGIANTTILSAYTAPVYLVSSATAGNLQSATAGTSIGANVLLLNTSTGANGVFPVKFL